MGLISTVIITNTSFVDRYESDQVEPYKDFLNFLSEESALTKKTLAWFIGVNTQSIYTLKKNEWHPQNFDSSYYPNINNQILFKDVRGQTLLFSDETILPFLIFSILRDKILGINTIKVSTPQVLLPRFFLGGKIVFFLKLILIFVRDLLKSNHLH